MFLIKVSQVIGIAVIEGRTSSILCITRQADEGRNRRDKNRVSFVSRIHRTIFYGIVVLLPIKVHNEKQHSDVCISGTVQVRS